MTTLFELSQPDRHSPSHYPPAETEPDWPAHLKRQRVLRWPSLSELQTVRHYTRLAQKNFSIDTHFYPLGSCTMKYNPKLAYQIAQLSGFIDRHPLAPNSHSQGMMSILYELQNALAEITGMAAVSLVPMAGAQGEWAGIRMIRAYHLARGDQKRDEILIPDTAHGTNPASATACGFKVKEIPSRPDGDVDMAALQSALSERTAGIMLTNPSTLGVFERNIQSIAEQVHRAGGLLYYDGANLNAILGRVRPGDMGFDAIHINLHKTLATPHGGGGPGAGPVGVSERLAPFLPVPMVDFDGHHYHWLELADRPQSIGRLASFAGNIGVLIQAYVYLKLLGESGLRRVSDYAVLNANYLMHRLAEIGFSPAYPDRRASHEFIISLKKEAQDWGTTAMDFAKRLLDHGFHAPTTYFPLLVPECFLIEPTETEDKASLDAFIAAMQTIRKEAEQHPETLKNTPHHLPVRRLDDVRAAKLLDLNWYESS